MLQAKRSGLDVEKAKPEQESALGKAHSSQDISHEVWAQGGSPARTQVSYLRGKHLSTSRMGPLFREGFPVTRHPERHTTSSAGPRCGQAAPQTSTLAPGVFTVTSGYKAAPSQAWELPEGGAGPDCSLSPQYQIQDGAWHTVGA